MTRTLRTVTFNPWAEGLEEATPYLTRLPTLDLRPRLSDPTDQRLLRMARLDCDWQAECVRCLAQLPLDSHSCAPGWIVGPRGLTELAAATRQRPINESWWLIFYAQHPQQIGAPLDNLLTFLRKNGVRIAYYAFDEASRTMPCFSQIAPHLDILIHDEAPLAEAGRQRLQAKCLTLPRSWVANLLPFQAAFNSAPEKKLIFLGSQLGLTDHRKRQIGFLQQRFKDRFVAIHDHSVSVAERLSLNRYKVSVCPEGRKFNTPAMAKTHTDRPFWSGCLGMVPVSEDSRQGGRLEELAQHELILRYAHGDLAGLAAACERALELPEDHRQRIYEHFNRHETVGTVVAEAIARKLAMEGGAAGACSVA